MNKRWGGREGKGDWEMRGGRQRRGAEGGGLGHQEGEEEQTEKETGWGRGDNLMEDGKWGKFARNLFYYFGGDSMMMVQYHVRTYGPYWKYYHILKWYIHLNISLLLFL